MRKLADHLPTKLAARETLELPRGEATRLAAVALVLQPHADGDRVLLIRRADRPGDHWSGHMGFPGGRTSPGDETTFDTAVRETFEEVGLDLRRDAHAWGRLDDVQAISKGIMRDLIIVPYVFFLPGAAELRIDRREVARALWADIDAMMRGDNATTQPYTRDGAPLLLPGYRVEDEVVWGLTYRMLELLFAVIRS
jgi:8-oxo-dGTP pyrophosphatase MutT (NUDIX family)